MNKMSVNELRGKKRGKIVALTAYDYPTARLLDEADVDFILVGDSLGMLMLGYPDTTHVTMDEIVHHTRAVARGVRRALVVADLPIHSYDQPAAAVANAKRLIEAGANAVKLEGGERCAPQIRAITASGIPLVGHLGMLPQHIQKEGKYRIKGKTEAERQFLFEEARTVEAAGACAVVLELVQAGVAEEITRSISIPTIGIGSGSNCDGQILVFHDLVGYFPWFKPRHVQPAGDVAGEIRKAVAAYVQRVREGE